MKKAAKILGILAILTAGAFISGCKSAPPLTQADAQAMIQAKYDQTPPQPFTIVLNDLGMRQGISDKYWEGVKKYPNGYWGDFKLTDLGKNQVKLSDGSDVIKWRPDGPNDLRYAYSMSTVALNHLKARSLGEVQDVGPTKVVSYYEDVILAGVPDALLTIAHNPGNELSTHRQATFVLDNGAWKLQSIE
ncbi:MAG: hypothetical protein ACLQHF_03460 [Terracidiphilus sp.]